jgi:hypothetical protein
VYRNNDDVKIWDWRNHAVIFRIENDFASIADAGWSTDGKLIVLAERGTQLSIWGIPE